ncbi:hypothetical protein GCM10010270_23290 [Streptomyces violaceus]|nr:hypothetical protein GCM10010270_23290 [Streptomyces janthinus]
MIARQGPFAIRLFVIGTILLRLEEPEELPESEALRIALETIGHGQWVCAAYLIGNRIPAEMRHLREYFQRFDGRPAFW